MATVRAGRSGATVVIGVVAMLAGVLAACDDDGDDASPPEAEVVESEGCETGGGGDGRHEFVHDGITREYVVHLPDGYDGETPAPLVYHLHGFGGDIASMDERTGMGDEGGARGYIVVTPQGEDIRIEAFDVAGTSFWNFFGEGDVDLGSGPIEGFSASELGENDLAFLDELLEHLLDEYCVDEDRVFSTGASNGAGMSSALACELDGRIRAIGPVIGVNLTGVCSGDDLVSVLAVHGTGDDVAAYDGNDLMGFQLGNPSVPDRMRQWATHNGCDAEPVVDDEGDGIVVTRWEGCDGGVEVELWTLDGWDHSWPRGTDASGPGSVDATTLVLDFFDRGSAG